MTSVPSGRTEFGDWLAGSVNRAAGWVAVLELVLLSPSAVIAALAGPQLPMPLGLLCWATIFGGLLWLVMRARAAQPAVGPIRLIYAATMVGLLGYVWQGLPSDPQQVRLLWPTIMALNIAALCVLGWGTLGTLVAGAVLSMGYGYLHVGGHLPQWPVASLDCYLLVIATVGAFVGLRRAQNRRAAGERGARLARAEAEALASQVHLRATWSALVHDHVLSVFAAVATLPEGALPSGVRDDARAAIERLTRPADLAACRLGDLTKWIGEIASEVVPEAHIELGTHQRGLFLPGDVALAILTAAAEAMRNVARHADDPSSAVLTVINDGPTVRVDISDRGPGFDPGAVPPARLGLRVAVAERMSAVGGRGRWSSAPGRGTVVTLLWTGEQAG